MKAEDRFRRGTAAVEDVEELLEPTLQEGLLATFQKLYGHQLTVHSQPADSLLARVYRELTRNVPTVISVAKVRSLFQAHKPAAERRILLGGSLSVRVDEMRRSP